MSLQGTAKALPPGVKDADGQPEQVAGKVRVVETTLGASGGREQLVDADSHAAIEAKSGASPRWRLVPAAVVCVSPSGRLLSLHPDIHGPELAKARKNKDGWRLAKPGEESTPTPEPVPSPTRWAVNPLTHRVVRIVTSSHDADLCNRSMHGWRWATDEQIKLREQFGATFNVALGRKET